MGLAFTAISATVLQIMWGTPEVTNGNIQLYTVTVETRDAALFKESVAGSMNSHLVTNLSKS